ncbi:MAG: hypothetical protein AAGB11_18350 [Pseudomonadota bacterium]
MAVYWALKGVSTLALVSALAGCVVDPAAPLIPLPERQGTVLPSEAPERGPDGFANVLADPVVVGGLPRPEREITAEENALEAEGRRTAAAASAITPGSSAAALAARGRNHVAETRASCIYRACRRCGASPFRLKGVFLCSDLPFRAGQATNHHWIGKNIGKTVRPTLRRLARQDGALTLGQRDKRRRGVDNAAR